VFIIFGLVTCGVGEKKMNGFIFQAPPSPKATVKVLAYILNLVSELEKLSTLVGYFSKLAGSPSAISDSASY
jgi:hypothetical protein